MPYNQSLTNRIRDQIQYLEGIEEKEMFGGLNFMLNNKMCVGVIKDEMMCRIDPAKYEESLEKPGCHEMLFTRKPMKGWVMIEEQGIQKEGDLKFWIRLAVDYNQYRKASKKK